MTIAVKDYYLYSCLGMANSLNNEERKDSPNHWKFKGHQKFYFFWKRAAGIFGALLALILSIPLFIIAIIGIKCSSKGPILFKQTRIGKNKKPFTLYKFRSMRVDVPNVAPEDITEETQRDMTTKFGRFLRKTSIDELPQLFNILAGQMAFIGPRPSQPEDVEGDLIAARESFTPNAYEVKPGLSGLAQIQMHRDHNIQKKAELDSYYVEHISLALDAKIFFKTVLLLFGVNKGK